ncbi:unnamed protein product, partial [Polarella glacialis]
IRPSLVAQNACISACARAARWSAALELLLQARLLGLQPDAISCSSALGACGGPGQLWQRALTLLAGMINEGPAPNVVTFGAAISAVCEKGRQSGLALQLLEGMSLCGLRPNAVCCNAAMSACAAVQDWATALGVLRGMRRGGPKPTIVSFCAAISAVARAERWQRALQLLGDAQAEGLRPNQVALGAAVSALSASAASGGATDSHLSVGLDSPSASSSSWAKVLLLFSKQRILAEAANHDPEDMLWPPSLVAGNAAVAACSAAGRWGPALAMLEAMSCWGL